MRNEDDSDGYNYKYVLCTNDTAWQLDGNLAYGQLKAGQSYAKQNGSYSTTQIHVLIESL